MESHPREAWQRLGALLQRRRSQIGYRRRKDFVEASGLSDKTIQDAERGYRTNFTASTLAAFEVAYRLQPGSLDRTLAGGPLEPTDDGPAAVAAASSPAAVPPWVAAEEAKYRRQLHDDAVRRGLDDTGRLVDGLNVDGHEDEIWEALRQTRSPRERVEVIKLLRDLDDDVIHGRDEAGTAGEPRTPGNGTDG